MSNQTAETLKLSKRIEAMSESKTIRMAQKSRELQAEGKDIVNLSVGEPDFDTPDHIKKAAIQAIKDGYTHYTPVGGYGDLKEAISAKFKRDNDLFYKPAEIMVSNGAKHSIINVLLSLVNPGDEVVTPAPYWVSYPEMIKLAGGKMVNIPATAQQQFKITPDQLERALSDKTKVLIFNSPSNPTGSVYSRTEMDEIAGVLRKYPHVYIISDEIYEHIIFDGEHISFASYEDLKERTILVNGVSKCFAMTGWRIGYLAADARITKACEKLQGQFTSGPNSIAQKAAIAALEGGNKSALKMRDTFKKRRDMMFKLLGKGEWELNKPDGAFYFFPQIRTYFDRKYDGKTIKSAEDLCMYILESQGVAVVPGDAFGDPNCIRISYANSDEQLKKGAKGILKALEVLS